MRALEKSVRVQCLRCGHFNVLAPDVLARLAIGPNTPIAAFVRRLSCRKCGSKSVLATRKPASQQAS
jgi:DNA-directed RNA polymerase subunit RPC12/RpoP